MGKKYFLLLKQHTVTGLKYLCFHHGTRDNCFKYKGSGTYWTSHLSKHGNSINTIILEIKDTREELVEYGLKYSKLWDVVKSTEFANLIDEDCNSTSAPLQREDVRLRRNKAFSDRVRLHGQTDKEKARNKKTSVILQSTEIREKAANTLRTRLNTGHRTEKEQQKGINQSNRIKECGFTEAELKAQKETSLRQVSKTMKERLNDPDYIDSRKGKSAKEIFGDTYKGPWNKGKTVNELKGQDYIDPRCKPFTITSHLGTYKYKNEREFLTETKFSQPTLTKLKRNGKYVVKRQSNTIHNFKHGETIFYSELR